MYHPAIRTAAAATLAVALAVIGPLAFATPAAEQSAGDRVAVVATTNIAGDIVAQIGGERLSLYVILSPGADPHLFQPTPRDARQVADAAIVFANGAGLEADFLDDLIASAAPRRVVELSAHLPLRRIGDPQHAEHEEHDDAHEEDGHDEADDRDAHKEEGEHDEPGEREKDAAQGRDHGEWDAHVWMDPTLVAGWTVAVAEALSEMDPEHAAEFTRRASELAFELHELDGWVREQVAAIPTARRVLVTDHDVFGYFARRYGFELVGSIIPGVSTASEPSARHLAELREVIAEHGIPAIFVGATVNPQVAQSIAGDLGVEVVPVYTGSLSEADGPAATYQQFIRTNVERIVTALAGT